MLYLLRWWWEFFHSILGDTAFAKVLAGVLALIVTPVAFFALLGSIVALVGVVVFGFRPLTDRLAPRADRLAMRFAYYIRDLFKR
jgi:hypothetical protein